MGIFIFIALISLFMTILSVCCLVCSKKDSSADAKSAMCFDKSKKTLFAYPIVTVKSQPKDIEIGVPKLRLVEIYKKLKFEKSVTMCVSAITKFDKDNYKNTIAVIKKGFKKQRKNDPYYRDSGKHKILCLLLHGVGVFYDILVFNKSNIGSDFSIVDLRANTTEFLNAIIYDLNMPIRNEKSASVTVKKMVALYRDLIFMNMELSEYTDLLSGMTLCQLADYVERESNDTNYFIEYIKPLTWTFQGASTSAMQTSENLPHANMRSFV